MSLLQRLLHAQSRLVVGLMSGTSLDGIDAAVTRLHGSGRALTLETLAFQHIPYAPELQRRVLANSVPETSSVYDLSQLNVRLAHAYADAVQQAVAAAGLSLDALDLVGSHGQTVHHVPDPTLCAGRRVTSTLQVGDPSVLAVLLGVPVVGDFRLADMALGGQGAPLVPYFDYVYFADAAETRGLLNLGGIANLTVLPRGAGPDEVSAFDTGPANMVIDALAQRFFGHAFDEGGSLAAQGTVDGDLLANLLGEAYFLKRPPKSTGREHFGGAYIEALMRTAMLDGVGTAHDVLATATALTSASVYQAYARFIRERHPLDVLIVSGGGRHNRYLMQQLADAFAPIPVRPLDDYGLSADAKEALCFAVLAHEALNGVPTNLPSVTGASRRTILGKICLPG